VEVRFPVPTTAASAAPPMASSRSDPGQRLDGQVVPG
jgi:hypothetical protein